jgi:HEAT repeat protein
MPRKFLFPGIPILDESSEIASSPATSRKDEGGKTMTKMKIIVALLALIPVLIPQFAAEVLAQTKESGEVERLIADLKDPSWQIRWYSAEALGEAKDPRAVEPLIAALKDKNVYVQVMAAWALGKIKDPRAVEPLIAALGDEIKDVWKEAALALKEITGKDFGKDPTRWQEWWEKNR